MFRISWTPGPGIIHEVREVLLYEEWSLRSEGVSLSGGSSWTVTSRSLTGHLISLKDLSVLNRSFGRFEEGLLAHSRFMGHFRSSTGTRHVTSSTGSSGSFRSHQECSRPTRSFLQIVRTWLKSSEDYLKGLTLNVTQTKFTGVIPKGIRI